MENMELNELFQIDDKRLLKYYERIKNQAQHADELVIITKFLFNQSIGTNKYEVQQILDYYKDKMQEEKSLLDFGLEWIRANKIRLEYKKYLIRAQYPNDDTNLAIDDCIYTFFLNYDAYLRGLLKENIQEHEIATLYEIFFSPFERKSFKLIQMLNKYEEICPTISLNGNTITSNIYTLRSGLSQIIFNDYQGVIYSRKEEKQSKRITITPKQKCIEEEDCEFNGSGIERMIKTYCINKREIPTKDIESAVNQLLRSHFKFGKFYEYEKFMDPLKQSLVEYIDSGLSEKLRATFSTDTLEAMVKDHLQKFRNVNRIKVLDGLAWINDLMPMLKHFLVEFVDNLFKNKKVAKIYSPEVEIQPEEISEEESIDFSKFFDLNLEIEDYRLKIEDELKKTDLGLIQKRNLVRKKVQEFQMLKRRQL